MFWNFTISKFLWVYLVVHLHPFSNFGTNNNLSLRNIGLITTSVWFATSTWITSKRKVNIQDLKGPRGIVCKESKDILLVFEQVLR